MDAWGQGDSRAVSSDDVQPPTWVLFVALALDVVVGMSLLLPHRFPFAFTSWLLATVALLAIALFQHQVRRLQMDSGYFNRQLPLWVRLVRWVSLLASAVLVVLFALRLGERVPT